MPEPHKQETVLVVDDEPSIRALIAAGLQVAGYRVHEARNGLEALKLFDSHGAEIDLLITDMRMPYLGGAELVTELRTSRRTLKILCISGYPVDPEFTGDFLGKPFSRKLLLATVRRILERP